MLKILTPVAESKHGYSYSTPLRVDKNSLSVVLPILRNTTINRDYILWQETEKVMVFDTGKIDTMEAENLSDQNVFIRSGTLFKGATQERALQRSAVLFPGKKVKLAVHCVHASRGISGQTEVKYGGITPLDFDAKNYTKDYAFQNQGATWSNVQKSTTEMNAKMGKVSADTSHNQTMRHSMLRSRVAGGQALYASSLGSSGDMAADEAHIGSGASASAFTAGPGADDLHSTFSDFSKHFDDVLSKVKLIENQAGLALITHAGVQTIEFFDHRFSWKALHDSAVKRLGNSIVDTGDTSVFEYKPDAAVAAVNRVMGLNFQEKNIWTHRPTNGEPRLEVTGLSCDDYVGEAVELGDRLIHLVILKLSK